MEQWTRSTRKPPNLRPHPLLTLAAAFALVLITAGCSMADRASGQLEDEVREVAESVEREIQDAAQDTTASGSGAAVTVERAVDGDTLELAAPVRGRTTVRLVGVDAPESAIPGEEPQPLGKEAADFTARKLEGERVRVHVARDPVDPYGRLLANVSLPGEERLHAEKLLANGLSQTLFYEPNTRNEQLFTSIQQTARENGAGIWSLPPGKQCQLTDRGNGVGAASC